MISVLHRSLHLKLTNEWGSRSIYWEPLTYRNDSPTLLPTPATSAWVLGQRHAPLPLALSDASGASSVSICHPTEVTVGPLLAMSWPWAGLGALHLLMHHFFLSSAASWLLERLSGAGCVTRASDNTVPESTLSWSVWDVGHSIFPQRTWSNWHVPSKRFHYCLRTLPRAFASSFLISFWCNRYRGAQCSLRPERPG